MRSKIIIAFVIQKRIKIIIKKLIKFLHFLQLFICKFIRILNIKNSKLNKKNQSKYISKNITRRHLHEK